MREACPTQERRARVIEALAGERAALERAGVAREHATELGGDDPGGQDQPSLTDARRVLLGRGLEMLGR